MSTRVTIGDFSRATHLSVKTLRHYHEVGLLEPSQIDPDNGYRYYTEHQIPTAQVIRRLRGLQMPIGEVKAVLSAPDSDARNRLIVAHLDRLETELTRTTAAVGELRNLLERAPAHEPLEHRTVPPTPAIAIQQTIDREDILAWWQGALGELHAIARSHDLKPTGPPGGIYASDIFEHGRGNATVFIPTQGATRPVGRVEPLLLPPAELAIARHHGSPSDIDLTYGQLGAYVMRHEISIEGPLREYYLVGLLDTNNNDEWEPRSAGRSSAQTPKPHRTRRETTTRPANRGPNHTEAALASLPADARSARVHTRVRNGKVAPQSVQPRPPVRGTNSSNPRGPGHLM